MTNMDTGFDDELAFHVEAETQATSPAACRRLKRAEWRFAIAAA
jgi:hypothetical protein